MPLPEIEILQWWQALLLVPAIILVSRIRMECELTLGKNRQVRIAIGTPSRANRWFSFQPSATSRA